MTRQEHPQPVRYNFTPDAIEHADVVLSAHELGLVSDPTDDRDPREVVDQELARIAANGLTSIEAEAGVDLDAVVNEMDIIGGLRFATQAKLAEAQRNIAPLGETEDRDRIFDHIDPAPSDALLTESETVSRIETQGAVKRMPEFADQVRDITRDTPFTYELRGGRKFNDLVGTKSTTEHQGLLDLWNYLHAFGKRFKDTKIDKIKDTMGAAESLLDSLNFIGKKEYDQATEGLGAYWKSYLNEDPRHKICVLTEVGSLKRYDGQRKSDEYLREKTLMTFSDEELNEYSGRIVGKMSEIAGSDPDLTKIVILDDWVISGKQMRDAFTQLNEDPFFQGFEEKGAVELNLIVATKDRIKNGLKINPLDDDSQVLPIRSYFVAHQGVGAVEEQKAHITGLHSSVNYDFDTICRDMRGVSGQRHPSEFPGLAAVKRSYRTAEPQILISKTAIIRTVKSEDRT